MRRHHDRLDSTAAPTAQQIDALARHRASAKLGWYTHACVYTGVIGGLAVLGAWQGRYWPLAPALGWGFGLAIHGLRVFAFGAGSGLRNHLFENERQRLLSRQNFRG